MRCEAHFKAQNASTGLLIIVYLIGRKQYLAACRILLICMIPKILPRPPALSNFGNGVSDMGFPVKFARSTPLHTNHNMNLNTHAEMIYTLRSRILSGQASISSNASVNC